MSDGTDGEVWVHCTPGFVRLADCEGTRARPCECPFDGSHDHLVPKGSFFAALEAEVQAALIEAEAEVRLEMSAFMERAANGPGLNAFLN